MWTHLDIYVSITFQWYKRRFELMGFDPCHCPLNPAIALWRFWSPFETPIPTMGVHLGMWVFIPSHSFALSGAQDVTPRLPSWASTLQAFTLVANLRLGLRQNVTKVMHDFNVEQCTNVDDAHVWTNTFYTYSNFKSNKKLHRVDAKSHWVQCNYNPTH